MNIQNELLPGEELLYQSKSHPDKVNKNSKVMIFLCILILIVLLSIIVGVIVLAFTGNHEEKTIHIPIISLIFGGFVPTFLFIVLLIYALFIIKTTQKITHSKNKQYFITSKRLLIYSEDDGFSVYSITDFKSIQYNYYFDNNIQYGILKAYYEIDFTEERDNQKLYKLIYNRLKHMLRVIFRDDLVVYLVGIENSNEAIAALKKINFNINVGP